MPSESDLRVSKLFDFSNHVVLVTGGASGIGEMAAQGFIQNGAKVYIASRKESELKKATDRFNKLGPGTCEYIVADLKDKAGCDHLVKEMKKRTDRLTVLVNNTGVTWGAPYDDFPESGWDKVMALNVKSVFYMTAGLQPLLLNGTNAAAPSRVINIASMAGISTSDVTSGEDGGLAAPGHGTFSCMTVPIVFLDHALLTGSLTDGPSKAACIHLSKILASKLAPLNIMVNCVCP
jgi:NAD(P)-dependent dehydrogenase (short-subunit alcohol dehydrogenase family)